MSDMQKPVKSIAIVKPATPAQSKDDGLALASLILGVTSVTFMGPITGIPAIILGALSLKNTTTRSYSITGIITGIVSLIFALLFITFIVLLIIFADPEYKDVHIEPGYDDSYVLPPAET